MPPAPLWRDRNFLILWSGRIVSAYGDEIAALALPLLAIGTLHATPWQMGLLGAANRLPFILIALFVGVWVDRQRRRPLLIAADLGRGLLFTSLPLAALGGLLGMPALYVVSFLLGSLAVVFDVAYQSFIPTLVGRTRLVEANSKTGLSVSIASITGPGLAGVLVQTLTAPIALLLNAASFIASAATLGLLRTSEPTPPRETARQPFWQQIGAGLRVVLGDRLLWANAACRATYMFSSSALFAVYILYLTQNLGLSPVLLGLVFAAGGPAAFLGLLAVGPLARRFGLGRTLLISATLAGPGDFLIPLATRGTPLAIPLLMAATFLRGFWVTVYDLHQVSLRQAITPPHLLGRMTASVRFLIWGVTPLGALLGGWLGTTLGLRPTLIIAATGTTLACLWLLPAPLRTLHTLPDPPAP
ncbi:MAG: MFS transporter [Thermomicrobiales bacterium]